MKPQARILVVDDEPHICHNCEKILTRAGHMVTCADNGRDALDRFTQAPYDVVVTDLKMTRMGGMEVLRRVKEMAPDTIVIVITGYATVSSAIEVMKLGAFDYLPKPFTPDELRSMIDQAIEAHRQHLANRTLKGRENRPPTRTTHQLVGGSSRIQRVVEMIAKVAATDSTVLVCGASGTGKELVARAVHANSRRNGKVFFAVDCGTLSGNLLESELFGHAKGAFTDAHADKAGIFEQADGGTVFLDEISNIDMAVQAKLLRFLESREFIPKGRTQPRTVNVRLIFATNQNLEQLVDQGRFRHDFYYRIFVYPIYLPLLKERSEDILPIAYHFIAQFARQMGRSVRGLSDDAVPYLTSHDWPGNVRELRNVIERAVIVCESDTITLKELTFGDRTDDLVRLIGKVPETN
ncbi:MAG: sigma-54-dependent Fis family transcriptional regulator, partial [Desulfatitalea sp.]|nr:sigma-54 dependent transcriptional regulator [Desulfatitalea sp.]NNK01348.1 sigma-54-dependent Fis family transcriptional regulator [Desulfatitalea sp.]